jgi:hypothetical protein
MSKNILAFLLLALSLVTLRAEAQKIQDLSFISGKWTASMTWGDLEEYWSEPLGNCMTCMFRCVKNGKVVFYEFIIIEQQQDSVPVMKLRHFNPGNIAWEDKEKPYAYPLVKWETNKARFESPDRKTSMTFIRVAPENLTVILERTDKEGKPVIDTFDYSRSK